jgi:hypothetical protein
MRLRKVLDHHPPEFHPDTHFGPLTCLDWDFNTCPDKELSECWHWEFKREVHHIIRRVFRWRKDYPRAKTFDDFYSLARLWPVPLEEGHLYMLSPEWPRCPFLIVSPPERRRRLSLLFPSSQKTLANTLDPRQPEIRPMGFIDVICNGDIINGKLRPHFAENVRLHIDYRRSHNELLASVDAWLKESRKHPSTPDLSARTLRGDLKALGALRLIRTDNQKDSALFAQQGEWTKARKRALRIIARF